MLPWIVTFLSGESQRCYDYTRTVFTVALKVFLMFCLSREVCQRPPLAPSLPWRTWTCPRFPATSTSETSISKCRASPRSEQPPSWALQGCWATDVSIFLLFLSTQLCFTVERKQFLYAHYTVEPQQLPLPLIPVASHVGEVSRGLFWSCSVCKLQIAERFAQ